MKRKTFLSSILVFATAIALCSCGKAGKPRAKYDIAAEYFVSGVLNVKETVTLVSDGEETEIKFNLYPNAYRESAAITPLKAQDGRGDFILTEVLLDGNKAEYSIEGTDKNVLCVKTDGAAKDGEKLEIGLSFTVVLSESDERASRGAGRANLGNVFPTLCAKINGKPIECEYGSIGDPFVSECADYEVALTVPGSYVVACGQKAVSCDVDGDKTMYRYSAECVRDVAFALNERYEVKVQKSRDRSITYCFYGDDRADETLGVAIEALEYFESVFGKYPYGGLCIAETEFEAGGMEYPCTVYVADDLDYEDRLFATVHEIAHQWWYGVVGNDQTREPYLDESLAEYSAYLYFSEHPSRGVDAEKFVRSKREGCAFCERALKSLYPDRSFGVSRALGEFVNEYDYVNAVYGKGLLMMKAAEDAVGRRTLLKRLNGYRDKTEFSIATTADFLSAMGSAKGVITSYLDGKVLLSSI